MQTDNNQVQLPVVFQCKGCRTIISDSCFLQEADAKRQRLVFSGAVNYEFGDKETPVDGLGESFCMLRCNHCKKEIGKWFHSTPRQMDSIRDRFCFETSAIQSYQIGNQNVSLAPSDSSQSTKQLSEQLQKMMQMMLLFHERLGKLELAGNNNNNNAIRED